MHIYVRGYYSTDVNINTVLFTLNKDFMPKNPFVKPIFADNVTKVLGCITINTNGQVVLANTKLTANNYFLIDATYFI